MYVRRNGAGRTRRIATTVGLASAALLVTQLTLVAPASAVPGLVLKVTGGPSNSDWKTTNAQCPVGTTVLGGGGRIVSGNGAANSQVTMDTMLPLVGGEAYSVTGREDGNGYGGDWSITTSALCAPAPAGLETRTQLSDSDSNEGKTMDVECPPGKKVLGLGAEMSGGMGRVVIDDLRPSADLTKVTVAGMEDGGTDYLKEWMMVGKAICATPPAGLVRVTGFGVLDSQTPKTATVRCPDGKRVHGVGGEIDNGQGRVRMTAMWASSSTTVTVTGAEEEGGYGNSWAVKAYAICA
ncbi:hypothetical protein [Plantactinospora sp. KLBMP9567]|uniref:hypothetical protein n=1 Tax=Plantactinospora sp. KLBMP9567 TaxID=3085900 RepID=UPI002982B3E3|nr:hypothetical protein [Plantactinospora sp. KLBMP9567]MDW5325631.1 hypothetical protein [Plantactinospora sp. KLBMP9567]